MAAYATPTDLERLGLNATALASLGAPVVAAQLEATSRMADGYLGNAFPLPLTAWSDELRAAVCKIAVFELLSTRGYDPARGADEIVRLRHDDAMRWLREVHAGKVRPVGMVGTATDTDPSPRRRSHLVVQADRGWGR